MANNPYVNKVQFGNDVLVDLTGDDAQASDVRAGKSFHLASGAPAVGTMASGGEKGIYYGVCSTAESNTAKEVAIDGITEITDGLSIRVKFENSQSGGQIVTLNVNNLGAIEISGQVEWVYGMVCDFVYDASSGKWKIVRDMSASTNRHGITKYLNYPLDTDYYSLTPKGLYDYNEDVVSGAVDYDPSRPYSVGERVLKFGVVYACTTEISTGESWTSSHWKKETPLQEQVDNLKSKSLSLTAAAGSWSSATPSTQTLTAPGVTATNNITVGMAPDITADEYEALAIAKIVCTGQGVDEITLTCYGEAPTINVPIVVLIAG